MDPIEVEYKYIAETKNFHKYEPVLPKGKGPVVGTQYFDKEVFEDDEPVPAILVGTFRPKEG